MFKLPFTVKTLRRKSLRQTVWLHGKYVCGWRVCIWFGFKALKAQRSQPHTRVRALPLFFIFLSLTHSLSGSALSPLAPLYANKVSLCVFVDGSTFRWLFQAFTPRNIWTKYQFQDSGTRNVPSMQQLSHFRLF